MMKRELICIVCPQGCHLTVTEENGSYTVTGNTCKRGEAYGVKEVTAPRRVITSTVKLAGGRLPRMPVKTNGDIPKELIFQCMEEINHITVTAPVKAGQVVLPNVLDTGVDVVATRTME